VMQLACEIRTRKLEIELECELDDAANVPIFVLDDVDLGRGTVGGYLISWAADGPGCSRDGFEGTQR